MELAEKLSRYIRQQEQCDEVHVGEPKRMTTGASRETWIFEVELVRGADRQKRRMVLRRDPEEGVSYSTRAEEFAVLKQAHADGIPVPRPLYQTDDALERPAILMEYVSGETYPKRLLNAPAFAESRTRWAAQLGETLARIHQLPLDGALAWMKEKTTDALLSQYAQVYRESQLKPSPVLELAFRWVARNKPTEHPRTFLHTDYRMGNLMFDQQGLVAVLDWELAHVGDPMYDLAFICMKSWRFDHPELRVGGFSDEQPFHEAYSRAGGLPIDPARIRYWEVVTNLFWATVTIGQARIYVEHPVGSLIEYAKIGRRTSECEAELLRLLTTSNDATPDIPGTEAAPRPPPSLHDHPDPDTVLRGVRDLLKQELAPRLEGHARFQTLIAASMLGIVQRQLALAPHEQQLLGLLASQLRPTEDVDRLAPSADPGLEAELCRRIQAGDFDAGAARDALLKYLQAAAQLKLAADNPRW